MAEPGNRASCGRPATGPAPGAGPVAPMPGVEDGPLRTRAGGLEVAAIFDDHMVLQAGRPIPVFGQAPAHSAVRVELFDGSGRAVRRAAGHEATCPARDPIPRPASRRTQGGSGPWIAWLGPVDGPGPYRLVVTSDGAAGADRPSGTERLVFSDVLVGQVWLAGGQSNMELELHNSLDGKRFVDTGRDPLLRFFNVPKTGSVDPAAEARSRWLSASSRQLGTMSAVAYHFARRLRRMLPEGTPVGIIDCYIGGTSISVWLDRPTLESCPEGKSYLDRFHQALKGKTRSDMEAETRRWQTRFDSWNQSVTTTKREHPGLTQAQVDAACGPCPWPPPMTDTSMYRPCAGFTSMVDRVAPYSLAGFLWYQGEEDEAFCQDYKPLLERLIRLWRSRWMPWSPAPERRNAMRPLRPSAKGEPDRRMPSEGPSGWMGPLPFVIVQLPQWTDRDSAAAGRDLLHWPVIRQAQWEVGQDLEAVYTICTMDCGEFDNIHPADKATPGQRLADMVLNKVYGRMDITAESPTPREMVLSGRSGVLITFGHARHLDFVGTCPGSPAADGGLPQGRKTRRAGESGFSLVLEDGRTFDLAATIVEHGREGASATPPRRPAGGEPAVLLALPAPLGTTDEGAFRIRYAWRSWGPAPLCNEQGLPAFPFDLTCPR